MSKRTETIMIRVTPEEKRLFQQMGGDLDGGMSELIRDLAAQKAQERQEANEEALKKLSDEEVHVALGLGISPAKYLAAKEGIEKERTQKNRRTAARISGWPGHQLDGEESDEK